MPTKTLWTYACNDVRFVRKDKPEVWITTDKINGEMFSSYPFFEFVPGTQASEPKRYGDLVFDVDSGSAIACQDALKIIGYFQRAYGVEPEQWMVFLSGKKGVHLELADDILGTTDGHVLLPQAYKSMAKEVEAECGIKLDTSMYNTGTGKPYRRANVMRDTGTCKRQIEPDDLYEIATEEEYTIACEEPGKLWEPEDTSKNSALAGKISYYLEQAEKHVEALKAAPKLSDEERDRLAVDVPACIQILSLATEQQPGVTFNDVALQLTAYAISAGKTEQQLVDGASVFIHGYPSTSLTTQEKRLQNIRDRYRCMAAAGNQHSCGGILALRFSGFDCKKCKAMPHGPALAVDVMAADDVQRESMTMDIPDEILYPGGIISIGMRGIMGPGLPPIPQFALPVILTSIANAIAGKIVFGRVWPNLYGIKIGSTSLGKSDSDDAMQAAIRQYLRGFYTATGIASGPALLRALQENPRALFIMDESTSLFRRYDQKSAVYDGIIDTLLEVYSSSGRKIKRVYSDSKKSIEVESPCLSFLGNTTPMIFDAIKDDDFSSGLIQRFDFWCYDGPAPSRGIEGVDNKELSAFAEAVAALRKQPTPGSGNLADINGIPVAVGATMEVRQFLEKMSASIVDVANAAATDGERGIISRRYNLSIKYALIHMAGTRPPAAIFEPMTLADIQWGERVAWMLADWKLHKLGAKISYGKFHADCMIFKEAIAICLKRGRRPTFASMADRKRQLKNWKRKDSAEVIEVLVKRGEIVLDESKRPTAYCLVKTK